MNFKGINKVYLLGIGGIGMSALARYFHLLGKEVGGYDKTPSDITRSLSESGIEINFSDDINSIPARFTSEENTDGILIIYTPAIPKDSIQFQYFQNNGFNIFKRSVILGEISSELKTIAVGGSHGKTTVSAMIAEILLKSKEGGSAFLGGISKTIESNLIYDPGSEWAVMEADEFDRSFLRLNPSFLVVTSMDPDHLDIYGDRDNLVSSFADFVNRLPVGGTAVIKEGLSNLDQGGRKLNVRYYGLSSGRDYYAQNITRLGLNYNFDLVTPAGIVRDFKTSVPGWINIENAVGAAAVCFEAGFSEKEVREGIGSFTGIRRRFDVRYYGKRIIYIDDYAHHPQEIKSFLESVRLLFPDNRICGLFQPHLFSRTRDFAEEFGRELSRLDELLLLDIYPARENPIEGVSSKLILDNVTIKDKCLINREELLKFLKGEELEILVSMGAGDIDRLVGQIEKFCVDHDS